MNDQQLQELKDFVSAEVGSLRQDVNERLDGVDQRLMQIDERFNDVDERFAATDRRFDLNDEKQEEILNAIGADHDRQGKALRQQADAIDDHETRIARLEKRAA